MSCVYILTIFVCTYHCMFLWGNSFVAIMFTQCTVFPVVRRRS